MALLACRRDGPTAALQAADQGSTPAATAAAEPESPRRLWFAEGPGREAILARERGDHDTAVAKLDELLADDALAPRDRAGALLLRALEDLDAQRYAEAAQRLAQVRDAPALATIALRLRLLEAQARLDGGDPAGARGLVDDLDPAALGRSPLRDDLLVIQADARARTDDEPGARERYRRYLREHGSAGRGYEVQAKLAQSLGRSQAQADLVEAVALYESLLEAVPLSDYGETAERELPALRTRAGVAVSAAQLREFSRRVALARVDAMLDRGRYKQAIAAADAMMAAHAGSMERCVGLFAKGTAVFKQRDRAKARPHFEQAVVHCGKVKAARARDLVVKSAYQAARGRYAAGHYREAALAFEKLAKEHADHTYADDAWVLAGESWAEAGDDDRARKAWHAGLAKAGDMAEEARRRLLVDAFAAANYAEVVKLVEDGLKAGHVGHAERAKLHYFHGRALAELGRAEQARQAWLDAVRAGPLEYASLQALSRLREQGDEALRRALAVLSHPTGGTEGGDKGLAPGAAAAVVLAQLGLGEWAHEELQAAEVDGWPAVSVLNQAGLYAGGQRLLASMGSRWRGEPLGEVGQARWRLAQPQPFLELVEPAEQRLGVPRWLTYAIMQTESRFDPRARSGAGARGLIQLMPATARSVAAQVGVSLGDLDQLYEPTTNLEVGMAYLARLVARFGGGNQAVALAIPSYNAGAGAVDRWVSERPGWPLDLFIEAIPYDETRKYTQSVLGRWLAYRVLYSGVEASSDIPYLGLALPGGTRAER